MPRTKQRSVRRRKRKAPCRTAHPLNTPVETPTRAISSSVESGPTTASEKKLSLSPHNASESTSYLNSSRTKQRSVRRRKRKAPCRTAHPLNTPVETPTRAISSSVESGPTTASEKKLSLSPHNASESTSYLNSSDSESESDGIKMGARILEVSGLQTALEAAVCCSKECGGQILLKEDLYKREGLCTHPYLFCQKCGSKTVIPFTKSSSRSLAINRRAVLANKCIGGSYPSLETFCAMLDLPPPVSQHAYQQHMTVIEMGARAEVEDGMRRAREELRTHYDADHDQVIDTLVSCDGTWQKTGFLFPVWGCVCHFL